MKCCKKSPDMSIEKINGKDVYQVRCQICKATARANTIKEAILRFGGKWKRR